ncbi:hypothetical protein [Methylobacterium sp. AMS5]|uniref:hypothetical protein n=1 Tax=Methylobacterium sp. AMS5 TaxID=925818 RepID=UPI00074F9550|nr:hypothetical protein [Methylobacterium sp. AMS5]AMB45083.1 hypothetical protein Y590_09245 [Methylobacterium sp. AMS5]
MRGSNSFSDPPPGAVYCLSCSRVSMGMARAETEAAVARMNAQLQPGEPVFGLAYFRCCPAPRYRPAVRGDIPDGATIGPVLAEGLDEG